MYVGFSWIFQFAWRLDQEDSYETSNRKGCSQQKPGHTVPWDPLWGLQHMRLLKSFKPEQIITSRIFGIPTGFRLDSPSCFFFPK